MQLCYSPIAPEDVENILAMQKELIERYEDLDAIDCQKVFAWCRRKIEAQMQDYRKILCDGVTAGYYALHRQEEEWELDDLYLYPAFQGKGIGTVVLQKVIADTAPAGLFLYVFVKNTGAVRLYERLGFVLSEQVEAPDRFCGCKGSGQERTARQTRCGCMSGWVLSCPSR